MYLHQVSVTVQWSLSYKLQEHDFSFPLRDQKQALFLIFHHTCKARRYVNSQSKWTPHSPQRVQIHGWKSNCLLYSHHYNRRTTSLGCNCTGCTEQTWGVLNKLKVSKKKQELLVYSRASKAIYESIKEKRYQLAFRKQPIHALEKTPEKTEESICWGSF